MQQGTHNSVSQIFTPPELCDFIQAEYHKRISDGCNRIQSYLNANTHIEELPLSTAELFHLLANKLCDELHSLFLKETGIVFPYIRQQFATFPQKNCIEVKAVETIRIKQDVITMLLQKLRGLLNNYTNQSGWSDGLKAAIEELFNLEQVVLQWIHTEQNQLFPKCQVKREK